MTGSIKDAVRQRYAAAALAVMRNQPAACCDAGAAEAPGDQISKNLYKSAQTCSIPQGAVAASLGSGNPVEAAQLAPGEVVLDLGSGGGIDVLLAARQVGPGGHAFGLDMTDEMLRLAQQNQIEAGVNNATFIKGDIEAIPLADAQVDVIISNCVINLAADKDAALAEAFRVLKPGGRFSISDMVFLKERSELDPALQAEIGLWTGCIAGALTLSEYRQKLEQAGFADVRIDLTRSFSFGAGDSCCAPAAADALIGSALIQATKPA